MQSYEHWKSSAKTKLKTTTSNCRQEVLPVYQVKSALAIGLAMKEILESLINIHVLD